MGNCPSPSLAEEISDEEYEFERCDSGSCTKIRPVAENRQNSTRSNSHSHTPKCATVSGVLMWKNGVIPYEMDHSLDFNKERIMRAMKTIESHSRMRFVKRSNQQTYLKITKDNGCYFLRNGYGHHRISLGIGCEEYGTVLHELMHAIGFPHEQKRPDRDQYITIHWQNIQNGQESQFWKLKPCEYEWLEFPFDYDSIMLYEEKAFSKNGRKTIEANDGRALHRKNDLSRLDKMKLRQL